MLSERRPGLPVVETFHSLQGEGLHAGRSAFFIRLAGCSVGCSWCDTKHSWPVAAHGQRSLGDLTAEALAAANAGAAFVVITGGEPQEQDLDPLCAALASTGLPLHLETSGTAPLSGRFAWITLSPKAHCPPGPELLAACDELKVVVHGPTDLAFAEAMAEQAIQARQLPNLSGGISGGPTAPVPATTADRDSADGPPSVLGPALLLQPGWESAQGQELAIAYVRSHPAWRLSLQGHKWLGVR
jgi:organic radical activating enzyme